MRALRNLKFAFLASGGSQIKVRLKGFALYKALYCKCVQFVLELSKRKRRWKNSLLLELPVIESPKPQTSGKRY